jgi:hypothetical protein
VDGPGTIARPELGAFIDCEWSRSAESCLPSFFAPPRLPFADLARPYNGPIALCHPTRYDAR